ncbi:MAG: hypothetical protein IPH62_07050 [Ignavibacteriae bacterium]|nr:hypothetical protein [Ignavibacteriota bacterium]
MKKTLLLISLIMLTFIACNDDNSIVNPSTNSYSENLSLAKIVGDTTIETVDTTFFKEKHSQSLSVNGEKGGKIFVKHMFKNKRNKILKLDAVLTIPDSAYKGDLTFDIIFDLETLGAELYPSPFTFDKPVILDLKFMNADLKEFELKDLTFDYLDGEPENLKYDNIKFDLEKGLLEITGAQIPHFSRYGWTRTK